MIMAVSGCPGVTNPQACSFRDAKGGPLTTALSQNFGTPQEIAIFHPPQQLGSSDFRLFTACTNWPDLLGAQGGCSFGPDTIERQRYELGQLRTLQRCLKLYPRLIRRDTTVQSRKNGIMG